MARKEQIVAELLRIATQLNTSHISPSQFEQHSRMPVSEIVREFGNWNRASANAGLSVRWSNEEIVEELQRMARALDTSRLKRSDLEFQRTIGHSTVELRFGTWNKAMVAAGLRAWNQRGWSDEEYLQEIIRLTRELGRYPSCDEFKSRGRCSVGPYVDRWGSYSAGCRAAYERYGFPGGSEVTNDHDGIEQTSPEMPPQVIIPQIYTPLSNAQRRQKVQFGEPIDFRGLRFAPINEQGVVYLFGMVSHELGFLIESIRTSYPDCEGKRCADKDGRRWEHVLVEFEYRSSNFNSHGHNPDECDLIVCWVHDWLECPIEVLELSSEIKRLANR